MGGKTEEKKVVSDVSLPATGWEKERMTVIYNLWLKHAHKRKEDKQLVFKGQ